MVRFWVPGIAGFGGLFRNSRGFPHGAFTGSIGMTFAFDDELMASIFAIDKDFKNELRNLWMETNSINVHDSYDS